MQALWNRIQKKSQTEKQKLLYNHKIFTKIMATLRAVHLQKSYKQRQVVKDVNLTIGHEIVGLLGPNGAGKTTSFYMLIGLVKPDAGQVMLDDQDISRLALHKRARLGIGYLP